MDLVQNLAQLEAVIGHLEPTVAETINTLAGIYQLTAENQHILTTVQLANIGKRTVAAHFLEQEGLTKHKQAAAARTALRSFLDEHTRQRVYVQQIGLSLDEDPIFEHTRRTDSRHGRCVPAAIGRISVHADLSLPERLKIVGHKSYTISPLNSETLEPQVTIVFDDEEL